MLILMIICFVPSLVIRHFVLSLSCFVSVISDEILWTTTSGRIFVLPLANV